MFCFLSFLVHEQNRVLSTVAGHLAALSDPLVYGYGIRIDPRTVTFLKRGLFHQRPLPRQERPLCSLKKFLDHFQSALFMHQPSLTRLLHKALFLTDLGSGLRSTQLKELTRFPQWMSFAENDSRVFLAPTPKFLAKNELQDHCLQQMMVPSWRPQGFLHPMCPIAALKRYLDATKEAPLQCRFYSWEDKQLTFQKLAMILRDLIEEADSGIAYRAHDVRGAASSLVFVRTYHISRAMEVDQWTSSGSVVLRYLSHTITNTLVPP